MHNALPKTRLIPRTRRVERRHAQEAVTHLKEAGYQKIQVQAARDGWDCPACKALDRTVHAVDAPPQIPPPGCRCKPYGCRLVVSAWHEGT